MFICGRFGQGTVGALNIEKLVGWVRDNVRVWFYGWFGQGTGVLILVVNTSKTDLIILHSDWVRLYLRL